MAGRRSSCGSLKKTVFFRLKISVSNSCPSPLYQSAYVSHITVTNTLLGGLQHKGFFFAQVSCRLQTGDCSNAYLLHQWSQVVGAASNWPHGNWKKAPHHKVTLTIFVWKLQISLLLTMYHPKHTTGPGPDGWVGKSATWWEKHQRTGNNNTTDILPLWGHFTETKCQASQRQSNNEKIKPVSIFFLANSVCQVSKCFEVTQMLEEIWESGV